MHVTWQSKPAPDIRSRVWGFLPPDQTASRFWTDPYFLLEYIFTASFALGNPECCVGFVPNFLVSHNSGPHGCTG